MGWEENRKEVLAGCGRLVVYMVHLLRQLRL